MAKFCSAFESTIHFKDKSNFFILFLVYISSSYIRLLDFRSQTEYVVIGFAMVCAHFSILTKTLFQAVKTAGKLSRSTSAD